jgi:DNA-binding IscR family transcriptional regulator
MAALAFNRGREVASGTLARSVNANPSFVRKSLSKLSKAGLIVTTRGKLGASVLARPAKKITLLDIYRASAAPPAFAIHGYRVEKLCPVSCSIKERLSGVLARAQGSFEKSLACITLADVAATLPKKWR